MYKNSREIFLVPGKSDFVNGAAPEERCWEGWQIRGLGFSVPRSGKELFTLTY